MCFHAGIERLSATRKIPASVWHAVLEVVLQICPHLSALGVSSPRGGWREVSELWYLAMQGQLRMDIDREAYEHVIVAQ